tara:strand:- start:974 stop:1444 length:471 start_codon:yes stop_codon:yes gene_type:complete
MNALQFGRIARSLVLVSVICIPCEVTAAEPSLDNPDPNNLIEWTRRIYTNGQWNATPDIAYWKGHYYVAINQGRFHNGWDDPAIVIRSTDLNEWEQVHTTDTDAVDCKLFPLGDRLIFYYLMQRRSGDPHSLKAQQPDEQNYIETRATSRTGHQLR